MLKEEHGYFYSNLRYLLVIAVVFFVSLVLGVVLSQALSLNITRELREAYSPLLEGTTNPLFVMALIFGNNAAKTFAVIISGAVFGIFPILFIFLNGFIIGAVALEASQIRGVTFVLAAILPHGVVEIPAALAGGAIGLRIGFESIGWLKGRGNVRSEMKKGLRLFVTRLLPLLVAAAAIESFITPLIAGVFANV